MASSWKVAGWTISMAGRSRRWSTGGRGMCLEPVHLAPRPATPPPSPSASHDAEAMSQLRWTEAGMRPQPSSPTSTGRSWSVSYGSGGTSATRRARLAPCSRTVASSSSSRGSIAAYKALELTRLLRKAGATVTARADRRRRPLRDEGGAGGHHRPAGCMTISGRPRAEIGHIPPGTAGRMRWWSRPPRPICWRRWRMGWRMTWPAPSCWRPARRCWWRRR